MIIFYVWEENCAGTHVGGVFSRLRILFFIILCARRCAPPGCKGEDCDTVGVVATLLRPRLTMLCPFGVVCGRESGVMLNRGRCLHYKCRCPEVAALCPDVSALYPHSFISCCHLYLAHSHPRTPEGRSMVNPGRRSETTTPGVMTTPHFCTLKGRSGVRISIYLLSVPHLATP